MASRTGIVWSRVFVEGTVILLSILLALAVDEWRGGMRDRGIEREYLERLRADVQANLEVLSTQRGAELFQLESARLVYPLISRGDWAGLDTATVVRAAYWASPSPTPTWVDDTFKELNGTGRMALIESPSLRAEVHSYYRFLEARDYTYQLMSTAYRDTLRARMDPDLQLRLRAGCRPRSAHCPVDVAAPDLADFVGWLGGNVLLADGLRRVIVQWSRAEEEFLPDVEERTLALEAILDAELAR